MTGGELQLADLGALLIEAHDRVDAIWNFLIGVHIALITGLLVARDGLGIVSRVLILALYGAFMWPNRGGLRIAYEHLFDIMDAIKMVGAEPGSVEYTAMQSIIENDKRGKLWYLDYAHPVAGAASAIFILIAGARPFWRLNRD